MSKLKICGVLVLTAVANGRCLRGAGKRRQAAEVVAAISAAVVVVDILEAVHISAAAERTSAAADAHIGGAPHFGGGARIGGGTARSAVCVHFGGAPRFGGRPAISHFAARPGFRSQRSFAVRGNRLAGHGAALHPQSEARVHRQPQRSNLPQIEPRMSDQTPCGTPELARGGRRLAQQNCATQSRCPRPDRRECRLGRMARRRQGRLVASPSRGIWLGRPGVLAIRLLRHLRLRAVGL